MASSDNNISSNLSDASPSENPTTPVAIPAELPVCRICWGADNEAKLIKPCRCEGTGAYIHLHCLEEWLAVNTGANCVVCQSRYRLPTRSRIRRLVRMTASWTNYVCSSTAVFILLLSIFARPLGLMMWFVFSASASDPFDSPMFLYLLKARETWNDVEREVDATLDGDARHLSGRLMLQHYADANISCAAFTNWALSSSAASADWDAMGERHWAAERKMVIYDIVEEFVNTTCGHHALFRSETQFRYCQCAATRGRGPGVAAPLAHQLARHLARLNCSSDADNPLAMRRHASLFSIGENSGVERSRPTGYYRSWLEWLLRYSVIPSRRIINHFLPFIYPRFRHGLVYIKYSPHAVDWRVEPSNPRFYGFPLSVRNETLSRQFVIKSLDLHFCLTLICGIFVDVFLFLRVWYSGMAPFLEGPWSNQDHDASAGSQGAGAGAGASLESWKSWATSVVANTKSMLVEQWDTLVVISVVNYEVAKAWWSSSAWSALARDFGVLVAFLLAIFAIYSYLMMLVSIVILKTFETDVLVY